MVPNETELHLLSLVGRKSLPETLYHYTGPEGLLGIVRSKSLFASDPQYLNDSLEGVLAANLLWESVAPSGEGTQEADRAEVQQRLRACYQGGPFAAEPQVFVASLSEEGDLLSQWRAYAPASGGFCLGLQTEALRKLPNVHLVPCVYDPAEQERLANAALEFVCRQSWSRVNMRLHAEWSRVRALCAALFKHTSFSEEREWRLVTRTRQPNGTDVEYRPARHGIIPYTKVNLAHADERLPLASVCVGPNALEASIAQEAVRGFLRSNRLFAVEIRLTSVAYRG